MQPNNTPHSKRTRCRINTHAPREPVCRARFVLLTIDHPRGRERTHDSGRSLLAKSCFFPWRLLVDPNHCSCTSMHVEHHCRFSGSPQRSLLGVCMRVGSAPCSNRLASWWQALFACMQQRKSRFERSRRNREAPSERTKLPSIPCVVDPSEAEREDWDMCICSFLAVPIQQRA